MLVLVLLAALSTNGAGAAAPVWPTPEAVESARKLHPFPDIERLKQIPVPLLPRVEASRPDIDVEGIARRHLELYGKIVGEKANPVTLRVFVTLAMPEASLRLLVEQAERSGATLVLRGLKAGSMTQTLAAAQSLIGERKVAWQIDPEAFSRYGIRHAPTFVLLKPGAARETDAGSCGASCAAGSGFFSVAGDVSLDYALAAISRRHPEAERLATPFLKKLRGKS